MIRLGKPVQLLEWGEGTNTLNQRWDKVGEGVLLRRGPSLWKILFDWLLLKRKSPQVGMTTLVVKLQGPLTRKNEKEYAIKVVQQGEGMTPGSQRWGEVAVGRLKSVSKEDGDTIVSIEVKGATKIGR